MDIAALSMAMSQTRAMQSVSVAMMNKTMDLQQTQVQGLVNMMEAAAPPSEHMLDIKV